MSKITLYTVVTIAVLLGIAGTRYYITHSSVVVTEVQAPATPAPPEQGTPQKRVAPDHGEFRKRFEPTPPSPNGGKSN